ncbi:DUF2232 domain-containing protein, partial [bacterium]
NQKRLPANMVWLFIAAGALTAVGKDWLRLVGINLLIAAATAYFFQGIAIIDHFFTARNTPRLIRWPTWAIIIINTPVTPLLVAAFGAFDLWFDFGSKINAPPAKTTD